MAKIAYGKRDDIISAIENGVVPENTVIITNDEEPEFLFYDNLKNLRLIEEKGKFNSLLEASQWLEKYDCRGLFFSVYDGNDWKAYLINDNNSMVPIENSNDVSLQEVFKNKQDKTDDTLTTTDKTIVGAINELDDKLANYKDYYISCTATSNEDNTLTVTSPASFNIIAGSLSESDVILSAKIDNNKYNLNLLAHTAPFQFVVTDNNKHYTIICDSEDGWSGYVTELATAEDLTALNALVGDVELETDDKTIVGAINEIHDEMGDIETALDSIINIQENLIAGNMVYENIVLSDTETDSNYSLYVSNGTVVLEERA